MELNGILATQLVMTQSASATLMRRYTEQKRALKEEGWADKFVGYRKLRSLQVQTDPRSREGNFDEMYDRRKQRRRNRLLEEAIAPQT